MFIHSLLSAVQLCSLYEIWVREVYIKLAGPQETLTVTLTMEAYFGRVKNIFMLARIP